MEVGQYENYGEILRVNSPYTGKDIAKYLDPERLESESYCFSLRDSRVDTLCKDFELATVKIKNRSDEYLSCGELLALFPFIKNINEIEKACMYAEVMKGYSRVIISLYLALPKKHRKTFKGYVTFYENSVKHHIEEIDAGAYI